MKKNLKNKPSKTNLLSSTVKTGFDNKLTQAALILEYAFQYNVNFKERTITISREIDEKEFDKVETALTEMESQSRKAITLKINSPGGEIYQALAIIGRLKRSPCQIITEGYGHVMSAATMILASGDKRRISKYAFFMHHEASYGIEGKHSEVKDAVRHMEASEQKWAEWMAEFSTKSKAFWLKTGVRTDAHYGADQLLKMGVVDEII